MALVEVSGFKPYSEQIGPIFTAKQTCLIDRPNHYSFGTKIQEFAVPLGEEVSRNIVVIWQENKAVCINL